MLLPTHLFKTCGIIGLSVSVVVLAKLNHKQTKYLDALSVPCALVSDKSKKNLFDMSSVVLKSNTRFPRLWVGSPNKIKKFGAFSKVSSAL